MNEEEKKDGPGIAPAQADTVEMPAVEGAAAGAEPVLEGEPAKRGPLSKLTKKQKIAAGCGAVAIAALAAFVGLGLTSGAPTRAQTDNPSAESASAATTAATESESKQTTVKVAVEYDAPGKQDGSTPAIVEIQGATSDDRKVDFAHALSKSGEQIELASGSYTVAYIGMINPDGSIERSKSTSVKVTVSEGSSPSVKGDYEHVNASDVADGEVEKIVEQVAGSIKKGDSTLTGDEGKKVSDTATTNAKKNEKVDTAKVDESKAEADKAAETPSNASTGVDSSGTASASNGHADSPTSSSSQGTQTGSSNSGNAASSSDSKQSSTSDTASTPTQQQHVHNWVAQTSQVLTGYTTVVDQEAYDEPIYTQTEHSICNGCGADITGNEDEHMKSNMLAGNYSCGSFTIRYKTEVTYEHHNAITHEEPVYETTTTYICSDCGTKQ